MIGWWCVLFEGIPTSADRICLYFHYASRISTLRLAYMLDSLVRVSRRVGWVHLNSGSRDLFSNWIANNECRFTGTSKKCQQYKHHIIHHPLRLKPRSLLPPSDKHIYTVKCHSPEWGYQDTAFSCSSNASRGPGKHSAPILASKFIQAVLTLADLHKPSTSSSWDANRTRHCTHPVPFQRFHALFHSLFRVLFIFPSRYLFAIGLVSIFSFRWSIPPTSDCTLKQSYSMKGHHKKQNWRLGTGLAPSMAAYSKAFKSPSTRTLPL